jgi:hypothetical protein
MVLLQDVVQTLDRSMAAATAQGSFRFHCAPHRAVEAGFIDVDDAALWRRWIARACGTGVWQPLDGYDRV